MGAKFLMKAVFSVILLHFNQPEYLQGAIDSVLKQSYPAIQLIVTDDGSENFSIEGVTEYIQKNKKENIVDVQVIHHKVNVGTVKNLNEAYKQCTGRYVLQFAADDALYDSDVLENFAQALDNTSEDVLGVFGRSLDCDEKLVWSGKEYIAPNKAKEYNGLTSGEQFRRLVYRCDIHMGSTAFLMQNLKAFLPLDQEYRLLEDWPLVLRATRNGKKFIFSNFKALLYRAGGVSRPIKERSFILTRYICRDHLRVFDKEILLYIKVLNFKELCDVVKRYDYDRKWMKRTAGDFETLKRIEVLKKDPRFLLMMARKIVGFQGLVTFFLGGALANYFVGLNANIDFIEFTGGTLTLLFLSICFVMIVFQDLLLIKRYLFNIY